MLYISPRSVRRRTIDRVVQVVFACFVALTSACASSQALQPNPFSVERPGADEVFAEVNNTSYYDMVVRAQVAGVRHRLGTVRTGESRVLRIPRAIARASNFALVADPIGSRHVIRTTALNPIMGQRVFWQIGETSYSSHFRVR